MATFVREIDFDYPDLFPHASGDEQCLSVIQKCTSDESGVVWDASLMLAKYLEKYFADNCAKIRPSSLNIVELGSGTGFLGLWLASMGACVLLTDLEDNLELIRANVEANQKLYQSCQVVVKGFDWLDQSAYQWEKFLQWKCFTQIHYIIISDCLYYKEGIEAIYNFIDWALCSPEHAINCTTKFLISYEDREDDKVEMCRHFLERLNNSPLLLCESITSEHLHPDYHSDDLHLLTVRRKPDD